ncbi:MAG: hypothetical protein ACE14L_01850 [Terriglobales bacterium]
MSTAHWHSDTFHPEQTPRLDDGERLLLPRHGAAFLFVAVVKMIGLLVILAAAYVAYSWLWGHGWLAKSACLLIWLLLGILLRPGAE